MRFQRLCFSLFFTTFAFLIHSERALAFTPSPSIRNGGTCIKERAQRFSTTVFSSSNVNDLAGPAIGFETSCVLTKEEVGSVLTRNEGTAKEKRLNVYGISLIFISLLTCPIWALAMTITNKVNEAFPDLDPNRSFYDSTGKIWSKVWLSLAGSTPTVSGDVEEMSLREKNGQACLYVANHASWLDIPVLCTVLDPVFKFIAKGELGKLPCIGQQLRGGNHIMIDREDRRSQLRTFKEGVGWLKNGVPLMAFPEGMRSPDGKLMKFKGGVFSMAVKSKVPIVPISISNTHAIFPGNALMPVQSGEGKLHVHVHPAIDCEGKTDTELEELVCTALLSKIPLDQHPIPTLPNEEEIDVLTEQALKKSAVRQGKEAVKEKATEGN